MLDTIRRELERRLSKPSHNHWARYPPRFHSLPGEETVHRSFLLSAWNLLSQPGRELMVPVRPGTIHCVGNPLLSLSRAELRLAPPLATRGHPTRLGRRYRLALVSVSPQEPGREQ